MQMKLTSLCIVTLIAAVAALMASAANAQEKPVAPIVAASAAADTDIELNTPTGTIFGSLRLPAKSDAAMPLVILHAGSGPTDRDGNTVRAPGKNDSLKLIAVALADSGIASLRFDKRGIAKSTPAGRAEKDLRFDDYVNDLGAWIKKMRADPYAKRFSKIIIAGHSEGSLIGMMAAANDKADGYISIAGIARGAADVLRTQLKPRLPQGLWDESERVLRSLEAGKTVDDAPTELVSLYRPSVQPYLISWFNKRPTIEIAKLTVPILIIQGTTDIQVAVSEAEALKAAAPKAELTIIEGMNHVLKTVVIDREKNSAAYTDPTLPLSSELMPRLVKFVKSI
jgi:uncharacterized protein